MKPIRPIGLFTMLAAAAGVAVLWVLFMPGTVNSQMMHGGRMSGMREMMQRMMGDVLPPGIDPALLPEPRSDAAQLLARYCTQCHNLPGPGMHTAAEWPQVVSRMNGRMQMMGGGMMGVETPTRAELQVLLRYLQEYAQKPIDASQYSDLNTPAGRAFHATCGQCHALPDPRQHTAPEWSDVVARMQKNMVAMGRPVPDESTAREIVGFLQRHAHDPK